MKYDRRILFLCVNAAIFSVILWFIVDGYSSSMGHSDGYRESYYSDSDSEKVLLIQKGLSRNDKKNYLHLRGFVESARNFPSIDLAVVENARVDNVGRIVSEYVSRGFKHIFIHGFVYDVELGNLFRSYPEVTFFMYDGDSRENNVINYIPRTYEIKYLQGLLAGRMTKTGHVGYISEINHNNKDRSVNAFALGVQRVNPFAKVHLLWINDDHDLGAQAAAMLIKESGADIINGSLDNCQWCELAEDAGVMYFGEFGDKSGAIRNLRLATFNYNMNVVYSFFFSAISNGERKIWHNYWFDYRQKVVEFTQLNSNAPAESKIEIRNEIARMREGVNRIFYGPVYSNRMRLIIPADSSVSDRYLEDMPLWLNQNIVEMGVLEGKSSESEEVQEFNYDGAVRLAETLGAQYSQIP